MPGRCKWTQFSNDSAGSKRKTRTVLENEEVALFETVESQIFLRTKKTDDKKERRRCGTRAPPIVESKQLATKKRTNHESIYFSVSKGSFFFLPCSMAVPDVPDVGSRAVSVCFFFSFRLGSDLQKKKKKDSTGFAHLYCDGGEMQRTGEKLGGRRSDRVESMQWHVVNTNQKGQKKTNQTNTRNSFGPGRCEEVSGNGEKQKTHAE